MTKANDDGGCWPTSEQELLLQAALLSDENCVAAWEKWKSRIDIDRLDLGSQRLLPLLYWNLLNCGIKDPLMPRFKSIYRRTWYDNQLLFHRVSGLLAVFRNAGIETIVLKGAALALLHYKDFGARPMNDFDVLVPTSERSTAFAVMKEAGWSPMPRSPERLTEEFLSVVHAYGFTDSAGRECDLHWHLFPECCAPDADDELWADAVPLELSGVRTRSLSPADQLLHVCVHGAAWNPTPPLRWIPDAMMILKTSAIDWDRLITHARNRRLILPLRDTLDYLSHRLAAPVPPQVLQSLYETKTSRLERAEYKHKLDNYERKLLGYLPVLWFRYLRLEGSKHHKLIGFIKYLQRFWGADHLRQLFFYAGYMGLRKILAVASVLHIRDIAGAIVKPALHTQAHRREISK